MTSIKLNPDTWDLVVNEAGNIASITSYAAMAQDVATACRLFQGELWYDTTKGLPYLQDVLGKRMPLSLIESMYERAALSVQNVAAARCEITGLTDRRLTGTIRVTDQYGIEHNVIV